MCGMFLFCKEKPMSCEVKKTADHNDYPEVLIYHIIGCDTVNISKSNQSVRAF